MVELHSNFTIDGSKTIGEGFTGRGVRPEVGARLKVTELLSNMSSLPTHRQTECECKEPKIPLRMGIVTHQFAAAFGPFWQARALPSPA
jgi:hypothetical protein